MTAYLLGLGVVLLFFSFFILLPLARVVVKKKNKVSTPTPVPTEVKKEKVANSKKGLIWNIIVTIAIITMITIAIINPYHWSFLNREKVDLDFPEIELNQNGKANGVVIPMNFATQVKVKITIPLTKVGISYGLCGKVVEPIKILDLVNTPKAHTEADDPEKRGSIHFMHLTREMKKHMLIHGYKEARVNFYLVEKKAEDPIICN